MMSNFQPCRLPQETRTVVLKQSTPERSPLYHDAVLMTKPIPALKEGEVLVKMTAAGYNHREVRISTSPSNKVH